MQRVLHCWPGLLLLLGAAGCHGQQAGQPAGSAAGDAPGLTDPPVDSFLGERLYPGEAQLARDISVVIETTLRRQYLPGAVLRDAHAKAHGCVKAEIRVHDNIPAHLAQGIFVPGKTWQAWIRFSNGAADATRPDAKRDARGMAIKVLGVPGKKLLADEADATTQDFILINHPVFFAGDPNRYLSLVKAAGGEGLFSKLRMPFALGARGMQIAWQSAGKKVANPLQARYWSTVPYQWGTGDHRLAVKYSVRPCSAVTDPFPAAPGHDYLRDALRNTLRQGDACMEFLVQPRTSADMDVEDSMDEWTEQDAPFQVLATIHIPRQVFDTPEQNAFCENLSFSPWHAIPAHRPIGITNRLRKTVYEHVSRLRHEMNSTSRQEPE